MSERPTDDAVPDPAAREAAGLMNHHRGLALGATLAIVGLGLVGTHPRVTAEGPSQSDLGAYVVLAGLLLLFYRIHRYGRLGQAGASPTQRTRTSKR